MYFWEEYVCQVCMLKSVSERMPPFFNVSFELALCRCTVSKSVMFVSLEFGLMWREVKWVVLKCLTCCFCFVLECV